MSNRDVRAVQRFYPQIYFACHVDHVRAASTAHGLSSHDAGVLSHLDETHPVTPAALARHLGVTASTLSALLERLVRLGYIERKRNPEDGRQWDLRLTKHAAVAMAAASVLDADRVKRVLSWLSATDRKRAVEGMGILARASGLAVRGRGAGR